MNKMLNLKSILLIRGVKPEQLAKDADIDLNQLTEYLNGKCVPSASTLHKLSLTLYVSEAALYCDEELWYEWCLVGLFGTHYGAKRRKIIGKYQKI